LSAVPVPAGAPAGVAVEVLSADKVYADGTRALDPVDLAVRAGEFVTLLGPSGCGKSTLLKMIANLISPTDGRLLWWRQGFDRVGEPGRKLVMVFQDATLMPWARVRKNVRLPLDLAKSDRAAADARVADALALVGLTGFERHYPRQLSGGMQMRVSIARALVTDPNLLLMDEPFGALDEITRNRLDADLIQLWWKKKLTVVFVTHSIYEAVFLSTRVVVMAARPGRVLKEVTIDEPHPRTDAFRVTQKFAQYAKTLSELLAEASAKGATDP
jgi:NitT/TauT family transport system ATP-binding protein